MIEISISFIFSKSSRESTSIFLFLDADILFIIHRFISFKIPSGKNRFQRGDERSWPASLTELLILRLSMIRRDGPKAAKGTETISLSVGSNVVILLLFVLLEKLTL